MVQKGDEVKPPTTEETRALHDSYLRLTGLDLRYSIFHHYHWERWLSEGFTKQELDLVVHYIKRRIRDGSRKLESFKFSNLIGNTERFAEDLSMARAEARDRQSKGDPNKRSVLASTGRIEPLVNTVRSAAQIMADMKAFEEFKKVKDNL